MSSPNLNLNGNVPFSKDFLTWLDEDGFYVRETWDFENNRQGGSGKLKLIEFQRRILAYALRIDKNMKFPHTTVLYSCPKKSGKTTIAAAVGAWFVEQAPAGTEIYILANDQEQAEGRIMRDIKYHAAMRDWKISKYRIELENGTFIQALAQSYRSVAGSRHALVLYDELWGITSDETRRTYEEMTPIPTISYSLRFISTYAGFYNESDLLWDLYIHGVGKDEYEDGEGVPVEELTDLPCWKSHGQFTYWEHEPRLPWQSDEYYDEQRSTLRPSNYLRLHENRWVTSHEVFIPEEWWDIATLAQERSSDFDLTNPYREYPVFIGVDAAPKRDCTAIVGVCYDSSRGKIVQLFHRIWSPLPGTTLDFDDTIAAYLVDKCNRYKVAEIVCDPAHLYQTIAQLKLKGYPITEFVQAPQNMTRASQNLYDLLRTQSLESYPDDEAKAHILATVAQAENSGFRIVKIKEQRRRRYIDFTVALAMAAYRAVESGGVDITANVTITCPFSDIAAWRAKEEFRLPEPFME